MQKKSPYLAFILILCGQYVVAQSAQSLPLSEFESKTIALHDKTLAHVSSIARQRNGRKSDYRRKDILRNNESIQAFAKSAPNAFSPDSNDIFIQSLEKHHLLMDNRFQYLLALEDSLQKSSVWINPYLYELESIAIGIDSVVAIWEDVFLARKKSSPNIFKKIHPALVHYCSLYRHVHFLQEQEARFLNAYHSGTTIEFDEERKKLEVLNSSLSTQREAIRPFENDASLLVSVKNLSHYYDQIIGQRAEVLRNHIAQKERFTAVKISYTAKSPQSRTQSDVESYNDAQIAFENGIIQGEATIEEINRMKVANMDSWNRAVTSYMHTYFPKPTR